MHYKLAQTICAKYYSTRQASFSKESDDHPMNPKISISGISLHVLIQEISKAQVLLAKKKQREKPGKFFLTPHHGATPPTAPPPGGPNEREHNKLFNKNGEKSLLLSIEGKGIKL